MVQEKLNIIPFGGLGEIGKNMMALACGSDIILIDAGLMFPNEEMFGVDFIIPDISYLLKKKENIKGMIITHGHEDHIGALPYILPQLDCPVYTAEFTGKLLSSGFKQRRMKDKSKLNIVSHGDKIKLGSFTVEFFPMCHSIPDTTGLIIDTPLGIIVHSGDFKIDYTPIIDKPTDLSRLAQLGTKGVLLLLSDSTYVELSGYTPSEKVVSDVLGNIIAGASGRVIITTFASLISRVQQVIDAAAKHNRRVFITGRSMKEIARVALESGYLVAPPGIFCQSDELKHLAHNQIVILATGSQGEPTSALVRIANGDHDQVQIVPGDTVVISATPIPGNESLINKTIDSLFQQGAYVVYDKLAQIHVHGHGSREELKLLLTLVKPKFFIPIHGEYRHLSLHAKLAENLGMAKDNAFVLQDGDILELGKEKGKVVGKIAMEDIYVVGSKTYAWDSAVFRDRKQLSQDGIVVVVTVIDVKGGKLARKPEILSRGFVDTKDGEKLVKQSQEVLVAGLKSAPKCLSDPDAADVKVKTLLADFFYKRTHRHPIIIPITVEA
jgi:ribonuclease J